MITVYMDKTAVNAELLHAEVVAALGGDLGGGPVVLGVGPVTQGIVQVYLQDWATDGQVTAVEQVIKAHDPLAATDQQREAAEFRMLVEAFVTEAGTAIDQLAKPDTVDLAAVAGVLREVLMVVQKMAAEFLD